jgi:hypothetical protein
MFKVKYIYKGKIKMKIITITLLTLGLTFTTSQAQAFSRGCGYKPYKPISCPQGQYVCSCQGNNFNQCNWVLIDC